MRMRQPEKLPIAALVALALVGVVAAPAAAGKPKKKKLPIGPNICSIASSAVAAAKVTEPCTKGKTVVVKGKSTPLGETASTVTYGAHWGKASTAANPRHWAAVILIHASGSASALELIRRAARLKVLAHGLPVAVSGGIGSVYAEPNACLNPPTHQCGNAIFLALKGNWLIEAYLNDFPPTIPGAEEDSVAVQEEAERTLEEEMRPALSAIGTAVASKV
jgi:hypothetical protein